MKLIVIYSLGKPYVTPLIYRLHLLQYHRWLLRPPAMQYVRFPLPSPFLHTALLLEHEPTLLLRLCARLLIRPSLCI